MSIYNEDELVPPTWINQEFLENVLRQYEKNDSIKITKFDITPASMKGDHYASIMFRCKISFNSDNCKESKLKSIIIKTMPTEEGPKRDMLNEANLFETEIGIYTEALPKIEKVFANCGEPIKLAAEIIYHSLEPRKVLIFEDLCAKGYNTLRERYLTEDEVKIVYQKLAKLHAGSFMLAHSDQHECITKFQEAVFCNSYIMALDLMSSGIKNFIEMLSQHEEFKIYFDKIKVMQPEIMENCKGIYNAYKLQQYQNNIFVLNHGDFHIKNLMFKLNANKEIEDVMMVDYQASSYAPMNIDLTYSQYMLLSPEFRLRRNDFMLYYFEAFIKMLKKINFQGEMPRYSDFQIAGLKYRHFSVFLMATFLFMVRAIVIQKLDDLKDVDVSKYFEGPEMAAKAYEHPEFIDEMRRLLPSLLIDGYLD